MIKCRKIIEKTRIYFPGIRADKYSNMVYQLFHCVFLQSSIGC